jgi:hypothetical protein
MRGQRHLRSLIPPTVMPVSEGKLIGSKSSKLLSLGVSSLQAQSVGAPTSFRKVGSVM